MENFRAEPQIQISSHRQKHHLIVLLCFILPCLFTFSACFGGNTGPQQKATQANSDEAIVSPPDIPDLPPSIGDETDPTSPQARLVYQDVIDIEQRLLTLKPDEDNATTYERIKFQQTQGFAFVHAVQEAIKRQVLTPPLYDANRPVYFEPQVPVTYQDFYTWMLGFGTPTKSNDLTTANTQNPTLGEEGWTLDNESNSSSLSEEEALAQFGLSLPFESTTDSQRILPDDQITRETLCLLYTRLSKQASKANSLSSAAVDRTSASKSAMFALGEFKDRSQISPWAAKYVAIAYRDELLKNVFGLRPTALVNGQGLQPKKLISRAEAITFLYLFFSTHQLTPHPQSSSASFQTEQAESPVNGNSQDSNPENSTGQETPDQSSGSPKTP